MYPNFVGPKLAVAGHLKVRTIGKRGSPQQRVFLINKESYLNQAAEPTFLAL